MPGQEVHGETVPAPRQKVLFADLGLGLNPDSLLLTIAIEPGIITFRLGFLL